MSYKILIAEDDDELRKLYKEIFKVNNCEVCEAEDGVRAVEVALDQQPDLIILDLMMPRQGGIGALRVMRTLPELKTTPVFVLTALNNPEYREMSKNWVQGYYLKTQIKPQELVRQAVDALKKRS